MAKSAKEKLAVDGTAKLAAKSKPNDKHDKKNLTIEEATIESPRSSRKRAGDFFDFGDEADRVADELAGNDVKASDKAGASKSSKPNKKAKTDSAPDTTAKTGGKKSKAGKDETLQGEAVAKDTKKSKGKKMDTAKDDAVANPSDDAAMKADEPLETSNKAKKGKGKKADAVAEDTTNAEKSIAKKSEISKDGATETKKGKSKKADSAEKAPVEGESLEDRVVAEDKKKQKEDKKKQKSKKADDAKKEVIVGPSGDTVTVPDQVPETANKAKKGKAAKEDVPSKTKKESKKASKDDSAKLPASDKPESSKVSKKTGKDSTKSKGAGDEGDDPKDKTVKSKSQKNPASADPKPSKKKAKATASKDVAPADSNPTLAGEAMDQAPFENLLESTDKGKTPTPDDTKSSKNAKAKKDTKKPVKESVAEKTSKKAKDDEGAKSKKLPKDGEATKPKKTSKAKENKSDIPDQAIQPMDLVVEEAALNDLSKAEPPKGKKRKAPADAAADIVKTNVLDPLSEHAAEESAKKKQKGLRKSLGATLGDMVATGADVVRNSFTGIMGGGGGGSGTDGKPTTTGSSQKQSKGKGRATDANDPQPTTNEEDDEEEEDDDEEDDEEGDAPDDQTTALLAGLESDGDDAHPPGDGGFQEGSKIPSLPESAATKNLKSIKSAENDTPGVVYIGRIPHGFYEHEMRTYFSQFGDVNRLRLSRSVKTGHSKHYAFLEFKNADVAKIVAETMDNYLMFGHILKCKVIAPGDVHEGMWKGANKRFKKVPWNKIEGRKLEVPVSRDVWKKREAKETAKRSEKSKKTMEKVGYAFEGTGLVSVDTLPKKVVAAVAETVVTEQEKSLVTAGGEAQAGPVVVSEQITKVKGKKAGKAVVESASVTVTKIGKRALEGGEEAVASVSKKAKKVKKDTAG